MEYSPVLPQDTKPLRSCSGNRAKMFLKSQLDRGDRGCIVLDRETVIVLVLLAFSFIPKRTHHSLTFPRSLFRDSATATQRLEMDGTTSSGCLNDVLITSLILCIVDLVVSNFAYLHYTPRKNILVYL